MSEATMYECPVCIGTGSMESSDSTDDGWWDCYTCKGTGRLADRRRENSREMGTCEKCGTRTRVLYAPEYGANFCHPCAVNPQDLKPGDV